MRAGIIGVKVGMTAIYNADGTRTPVTLIKLDSCQVVDQRVVGKHGYNSLVIGSSDQKRVSRLSKSMNGVYSKLGVRPKKILKEFRVTDANLLSVGYTFNVSYFIIGQYIDVAGYTIGKGFAGVMKRHNFAGLEASHGVSISHRSHGSTGQRQDPGKVFKNKKMAGHMGCKLITKQNLQLIGVDQDNNVLIVKGAIPGHNGGYVYVSDAIKKLGAWG